MFVLWDMRVFENVKLLEVSSIHDGHDQTKFVLCLEGVRQWHNKATVNLLKNPLLHHRTLQEEIRKDIFFKREKYFSYVGLNKNMLIWKRG